MHYSDVLIVGIKERKHPCPQDCPLIHSVKVINSYIKFDYMDKPSIGRVTYYIINSHFVVQLEKKSVNIPLWKYFEFVIPPNFEQSDINYKNYKTDNNNNNKKRRIGD